MSIECQISAKHMEQLLTSLIIQFLSLTIFGKLAKHFILKMAIKSLGEVVMFGLNLRLIHASDDCYHILLDTTNKIDVSVSDVLGLMIDCFTNNCQLSPKLAH